MFARTCCLPCNCNHGFFSLQISSVSAVARTLRRVSPAKDPDDRLQGAATDLRDSLTMSRSTALSGTLGRRLQMSVTRSKADISDRNPVDFGAQDWYTRPHRACKKCLILLGFCESCGNPTPSAGPLKLPQADCEMG